MCDPPVATSILVGDGIADRSKSNPRCAISVKVSICSTVPNLRGSNGGNGATKTVTCDDDSVARVCGLCASERWKDIGFGFLPRDVEAPVYFTVAANVGGVDGEDGGVGDPVADRGRTAEGEND